MSVRRTEEMRQSARAAWTPERRERQRQQSLLYWSSPQAKAAQSQRMAGEGNGFHGKKHSSGVRRKLSEQRIGRAPRLRKYGITDEEYARQKANGNEWCTSHKAFFKRTGTGPNYPNYCPDCATIYRRRQTLRGHGVTKEWFDRTLAEQHGGCGICGKPFPEKGRYHLHIDHSHATNERRGILCGLCNTALERIESIPEWGSKASAYLARFPKQ